MNIDKTNEFLEKIIPEKRIEVVGYILDNLKLEDPDLTHQNVKKFTDILGLMSDLTDTAEANKPLSVDLTSDNDILVDNIFWTEERLNAIEDYILPDLKEYFEGIKKKILYRRLISLITEMITLKSNC